MTCSPIQSEALRSTIMAAVDENSNAVLQGIARHINCLSEENRNTRKKALESIRNDTVNRKPPLEDSDLGPVFSEVLKPLLKTFSDPVEKCRELSVGIVHRFFEKVSDPEERLSYVFPVLVQRLGQQEIVEPSEELRLQLVELFSLLIDKAGQKLPVYLEDSIRILQRTLVDPFPEVKKESCKCASKIAKAIPQYFHMVSETLIKPLLMSVTHQHSRMRALVVTTIGRYAVLNCWFFHLMRESSVDFVVVCLLLLCVCVEGGGVSLQLHGNE